MMLACNQIGEGLDGRVITKGLSEFPVQSAEELVELVEVAKSRRTTGALRGFASTLSSTLFDRRRQMCNLVVLD